MFRIKTFLLFLFISANVFGQSIPLSDNARVSVLTCGLSTEIYALFGHTAIRINDPENRVDIVYNYGAFDFSTPNFELKFAKGDLQYFVTSNSYEDFIGQYQYEQRSVYEQVLNIDQTQKQSIFDHLNQVLFSADRYYTYKFIDRNCTNMAVETINDVLGKGTIHKIGDTDITYRQTLYPFFGGHFFEKLGTQILFGTKVDGDALTLFLPFELKKSIEKTVYNNKPLMESSKTIIEFPTKEMRFSWWNNIFTLLFLCVIVIFSKNAVIDMTYLVVVSIVGLLFCYTMGFSLHSELQNNYNILLFNPLLLILVFVQMGKNNLLIYWMSIFAAICLAIYLLIMINKAHLPIVLPIVITNIVVIGRLFLECRTRMKATEPVTVRDKTVPY